MTLENKHAYAWPDRQAWPSIYIDENGTVYDNAPENVDTVCKRIPQHIMNHYPNLKVIEHKGRIIITITSE